MVIDDDGQLMDEDNNLQKEWSEQQTGTVFFYTEPATKAKSQQSSLL